MTFITPIPSTSPGTILPYSGVAAPSGYLLCDGAAVSRTSYSDLFAVVGELFGVGDGSTTFNVPDTQGKIPVGKGASGVTNIGDTGGEQTHTLDTSEMPSHKHTMTGAVYSNNNHSSGAVDVGQGTVTTSSVGGGTTHENMQPYVGTEYIIKT